MYDIDASDKTYNSRSDVWYEEGAFSSYIKLGRKLTPEYISAHSQYGFSSPELTHVWTDGNEAILSLGIKEEYENLELDMSYDVFRGKQKVELYVNDTLIANYTAFDEVERSFIIPHDAVLNGSVNLRFELCDAEAPINVSETSTDTRRLALSFKEIN